MVFLDADDARVIRRHAHPSRPMRDVTYDCELAALFAVLPEACSIAIRRAAAQRQFDLYELNEVFIQKGRVPEAVFSRADGSGIERVDFGDGPSGSEDIEAFQPLFDAGQDTGHKRRGVEGTLHRISLITHPARRPEQVIGIAARVGRSIRGIVERMAPFVLQRTAPLLLIGRPGVGKTSVLRELARLLSADRRLNVVVVDKTCEIAGDSITPHEAIGSARWMPVGVANRQADVLREAVENQRCGRPPPRRAPKAPSRRGPGSPTLAPNPGQAPGPGSAAQPSRDHRRRDLDRGRGASRAHHHAARSTADRDRARPLPRRPAHRP